MSIIQVSKDQFQMITILLKHLVSDKDLDSTKESLLVDTLSLKNYLLKKAVLPIEVKNKLFKNFDGILNSIINLDYHLFSLDEENSKIIITRSQICSLIKPLISNAAVNPLEKQKLNLFFDKFSCTADQNDFFLELI